MPSSAAASRLFASVKIGGKEIHRVAMAPLTRFRADTEHVPTLIVPEYYVQRASPGGLIVSEATFIAKEASGYATAPGIYTQDQINQWKEVTKGVHSRGGVMYLQLWALGRANQGGEEGVKTVSSSDIPLRDTKIIPEPLSIDDIKRYVGLYRQAALNAIEAGFDGVEIHGANGYLIDQFNQDTCNKRADAYGGSVENRSRFVREILAAVTEAIGQEKTALRLSPWSRFQDMGVRNPLEFFEYLSLEITKTYPKLSYVHFVEPVEWSPGTFDIVDLDPSIKASNDYFRAIFRGLDPKSIKLDEHVFPDPTPEYPIAFLAAGGFKKDTAPAHADRTGDVTVFGRLFISTPDLCWRIANNVELTPYNRATFYSPGPVGYTDMEFASEESKNGSYTLIHSQA